MELAFPSFKYKRPSISGEVNEPPIVVLPVAFLLHQTKTDPNNEPNGAKLNLSKPVFLNLI